MVVSERVCTRYIISCTSAPTSLRICLPRNSAFQNCQVINKFQLYCFAYYILNFLLIHTLLPISVSDELKS